MRYDPDLALSALTRLPAGAPVVVGQLGQSLDGRVATETGHSKYISGQGALAHLHRLRAAADVVVVGVNTVIVDDPALTVRHAPGRSPARVVIDPLGRLPGDARCLSTADGARVAVLRPAGAAPPPPGVELIETPAAPDGRMAPAAIRAALTAHGLPRILIEGGPDTLSRAIDAGVVDLLHVMVAPIIIGSGKPGLTLPPIARLDGALRPAVEVSVFDDGDVLFACDLRRS